MSNDIILAYFDKFHMNCGKIVVNSLLNIFNYTTIVAFLEWYGYSASVSVCKDSSPLVSMQA